MQEVVTLCIMRVVVSSTYMALMSSTAVICLIVGVYAATKEGNATHLILPHLTLRDRTDTSPVSSTTTSCSCSFQPQLTRRDLLSHTKEPRGAPEHQEAATSGGSHGQAQKG